MFRIDEAFTYLMPIGLFTFLSSLIGTKLFITRFGRRARQAIREDAPERHRSKEGTPTMGGIVFSTIILLVSILAIAGFRENLLSGHPLRTLIAALKDKVSFIAPLLVIAGGNLLLGLVDDLAKVLKAQNLGLKARYKFLAHLLISGIVLWIYIHWQLPLQVGIQEFKLNFSPWTYFIWLFLVISGTTNAVNLTDGLDGLAATLVIISLLPYLFIGGPEVNLTALITISALLGFLYYNAHPAEIFMGDSGSLFLGGLLATLALYTHTELMLLVWGFIFVMEALSVMIQVSYFKLTKWLKGEGKRVFLMTPIHHHFEKMGWSEPQVVIRFSIVQLWLTTLGLWSYHLLNTWR